MLAGVAREFERLQLRQAARDMGVAYFSDSDAGSDADFVFDDADAEGSRWYYEDDGAVD